MEYYRISSTKDLKVICENFKVFARMCEPCFINRVKHGSISVFPNFAVNTSSQHSENTE